MVDLIDSIKSNPIAYYVGLLIGLALLALVIYLIVKNDKRKKEQIREKNEEKARIERHVDLEAMIAKMQEQEQNKLKDIDPVANFEQEQEEKAIISYQELVNAVKTDNKEPIPVINVSSKGDVLSTTNVPRMEIVEDKPIFIDEIKLPKAEMDYDLQEEIPAETPINIPNVELSEVYEDKKVVEEFKSEIKEINEITLPTKKESVRFKNSEFISPIYGRQNSNISYPKIASFKANLSDTNDEDIVTISDDVDPNDEFLKTLREFRNN